MRRRLGATFGIATCPPAAAPPSPEATWGNFWYSDLPAHRSLSGTCSSATHTVASWTRCTRRLYPPATERVHRLSATERLVRLYHTDTPTPKGLVNPMLTKSVADIWKCSPHRITHERIRQPSSQHRDTRVAREASWNRSRVREHSAGRRSSNNRGKPC